MGNATSIKHHVETAEKTGVLQLSKSNLREIPKDLLEISKPLRTLDLSFNRLRQMDDNFNSFENLKILKLGNNRIKFISQTVDKLVKLETLLIDNNFIEFLPDSIEKFANLKTLNLSSNRFKMFPKQVCELKNIELLDLSMNEIDSIPDDIGRCNANEINLNNNKLNKLNDHLKDCPKLKILRLDYNGLELKSLTKPILAESKICLLSLEGVPFTLKQMQELDGYEQYMERYTSTKRKLM